MSEDLLEQLARLPSVSFPTVSPDGSRVALYYDGTGRNQLHVLDVATGSLDQWSDGDVPRTPKVPPMWSTDGERVYFHRDEGGDEQNDIYAVDAGGDAECVVALSGQTFLQDVGDDGDTLVLSSTADGQMNLYVHSLADGTTERITDYDRAVYQAVLSPDCERVAFATNDADDFDNQDVFVADVDGSNARNLEIGETGAEASPLDWHPDGTRLLVGDTTADRSRCGIYDVDADEVTWLGSPDAQEEPVGFGPDGDRVVAIRTRDAADVGVVFDVDSGASHELDLPDGVTSIPRVGPAFLDDGRLFCTHQSPTTRESLYAYDVDADEAETLLAAEYGDVDPDTFRDAEFYTVASNGVADTPARAVELDPAEELEIECLLFDSGVRLSPLVVNPHGGPPVQEKRDFDLYTQFLLTRGYSVLQVNYRGSAGRGRAFREALYGDWGGAEQADVATAAEHALETREWLDDERVLVLGGSYGGYSAYWQMVQYPDLYAAGVANVGVTDLFDMYENSMPHYRTELLEKYLGTPEENPDLYEERSPVTHAENLAAPLLMIHGVNDPRVPLSQAERFRDALLEAGYEEDEDFEYVELGEQGHGTADIEQKIRAFRVVDDFLERRFGRPGLEVA